MMTAVLIDDEPIFLAMLEDLLEEHCPDVRILGRFSDPAKALLFLKETVPDVLFVDVEMPVLNGFELLRALHPFSYPVIFITASNQHALRAIKFSALDYLLKPVEPQELVGAVEKVSRRRVAPELQQLELMESGRLSKDMPRRVALSTMEGLTFVEVDRIVYCQSDGSYSRFYLEGDESLLISRPIKEVAEMLGANGFFRIHNSYLINLSHLQRYIRGEGGEVVLSNGHRVPVSRARKQEFLDRISRL